MDGGSEDGAEQQLPRRSGVPACFQDTKGVARENCSQSRQAVRPRQDPSARAGAPSPPTSGMSGTARFRSAMACAQEQGSRVNANPRAKPLGVVILITAASQHRQSRSPRRTIRRPRTGWPGFARQRSPNAHGEAGSWRGRDRASQAWSAGPARNAKAPKAIRTGIVREQLHGRGKAKVITDTASADRADRGDADPQVQAISGTGQQ